MANKLNMAIAKTHRLSSRMVGMQFTAGNFIGIALSSIQMSAGFIIIGHPVINGNWMIAILIAFIGILLAILIERLSLAGLSSVRVSQQQKRVVDDAFFQIQEPSEQEQKLHSKREKEFSTQIRIGVTFGVVGMLLSAGVGDVFWHKLFEPLQPPALGYIMSIACAAVIGVNFVLTELFKALLDGVLKEILADMTLLKTAVAVEGQNMQLDMMVDSYEAVKNDAEVRAPAEDKIKKVIARNLTGFAYQVSQAADQVADFNSVRIVEGSVAPLALPAPRGKYAQRRDELRRLLASNPTISQRDVARHFSISNSTASEWLKKARNGE